MKPLKYIPPTDIEIIRARKLKIAYARWLGQETEQWKICVCWHAPDAMRRYYRGYTEDWLAKELTRYFNKVDRRIFKAAHKNRGIRLQRVITLEHDDNVGWHAHGIVECAQNMDEAQTYALLETLWLEHTNRFSTGKFEKHLFWSEPDQGYHLPYIVKRLHTESKATPGVLDTRNTYILN